MTNSINAKRYAQAVFGMAQEQKELNKWQSSIRKLAGISRDEALYRKLEDQDVPFDEKTVILSDRLGELDPMLLKLISILVSKERLDMLGDIADEFQQLVDNYHGIEGVEVAEITTAIELDDDYKLVLAQRLTQMFGKPVVLKTNIDESILGGIIIRVGDKLIDGSVSSKLEALRKDLSGSRKR